MRRLLYLQDYHCLSSSEILPAHPYHPMVCHLREGAGSEFKFPWTTLSGGVQAPTLSERHEEILDYSELPRSAELQLFGIQEDKDVSPQLFTFSAGGKTQKKRKEVGEKMLMEEHGESL